MPRHRNTRIREDDTGFYTLRLDEPDPFETVAPCHREEVEQKAALLALCDPGDWVDGVGYKYKELYGFVRIDVREET